MVTMELMVALFLTLSPLTFSPGPANLLLASAGTTFGLRRSVPFMLGIEVVFALQCLVVGIGLGELIFRLPAIVTLFKYAGAFYLVYLAYHFFRAAAIETPADAPLLDFRQGAIMEAANFNAFSVQALMFALFLDPTKPQWSQVIFLTLYLSVLGVITALTWLTLGDLLGRVLRTEGGARWQGRVFGVILLLVALWMVVRES